MLQQTDVPRHQRRGGKAKHLPEGKIPGHHREYHAERLKMDEALRGIRFDHLIGEMFLGILGVIAANQRALFCFLHRGLDGLAHLQGHHAREFLLLVLENFRRAHHHLRALGETRAAMTPK